MEDIGQYLNTLGPAVGALVAIIWREGRVRGKQTEQLKCLAASVDGLRESIDLLRAEIQREVHDLRQQDQVILARIQHLGDC